MKILFVLLAITVGAILFSIQGFGGTINTSAEINKIGTLKISDSSSKTLTELDLGINADISSVNLKFKDAIAIFTDVTISLKDNNDVEIGSGTTTVLTAATDVSINLTDTVTSGERSELRAASITTT